MRKNLVYGPQTVGTKGKKLLSCIVNKREHSRFRVKSAYLNREHGTGWHYNPGRAKTLKPLKLDATMTNELINRLTQAKDHHHGTDHGGLLQWAILHIESQSEALDGKEQEIEFLLTENRKMHAAIKGIMAMADSLSAAAYDAHPLRDYVGAVDTAPHINLMGGHYKDPDYRKGGASGLATTHVDVRGAAPRKAEK